MKNYRSNVAFIDLLFNLLTGFVSLFIIALLLINPVAKQGIIDPQIEILIEMDWAKKSDHDYDMWVKGPGNEVIGFSNKEGNYMTLERDDLGVKNDRFYNPDTNTWTYIERNLESLAIRGIVPGTYYVNVHFFAKRDHSEGDEVCISVKDMSPYQLVADRCKTVVAPKSEHTFISFRVTNDGKVTDVDYNAQVRIKPIDVGSESL